MNNLKNTFELTSGKILYNVHSPEECSGKYCIIHNPSDHHMKDWPLIWRNDRRIFERICPCGVGHPDPDALRHESAAIQKLENELNWLLQERIILNQHIRDIRAEIRNISKKNKNKDAYSPPQRMKGSWFETWITKG